MTFPLPETVLVPGGEFAMGDDEGRDDERPVHPVRVLAFRLGVTPVTNDEYATFLREFINGARAAKKAGKTAAQFAAEWKTPAKFVGYQPVTTEGPGPNLSQADFAKNDAQVVFDELK